MTLIETNRLRIRWLERDDAAFILALVNDPDWIRHIGDKNVRDLDDARRYIAEGPVAMYERHGFGLNAVVLKATGEPIGICGILKRESLEWPDLGFAFLPAHRGRGYAHEAAAAVMGHARSVLGLGRIAAVVSPGNDDSVRLLEKLGLRFSHALDDDGADRLEVYFTN